MTSKISEGVTITAETFYQPEYSNPGNNEFMFAYRITIENSNRFPVQLLSRHWHIFDSDGVKREVQGDGVIGVQPTLEVGGKYQYVSGCNLRTDMGRMHGSYSFQNLYNKKDFVVAIPSFEMIVPARLN